MDRAFRVLLFLFCALAACGACGAPGAPNAPVAKAMSLEPTETVDLAVDWDAHPASPEPEPGAPLSLTADDGTGLRVVSLDARAAIAGPLAFTELHLLFENPTDRQLEGTFSIALPARASVSRFAMRSASGTWLEGEVVARAQAQQAYESFLHARVDPALLEKDAGHRFHARVFPILARERKEIVVSYAHELASDGEPYRLDLRGLPRLDQLDAQIVAPIAGGARGFVVHKRGWIPDRDLRIAPSPGVDAVRHDRFVAMRVTPLAVDSVDPIDGLAVLVDTSASRATELATDVARVKELLATLAIAQPKLALRVACFDQEVAEIYAGPAAGFEHAAAAKIVERGALGASDLGRALAWARGAGAPRVLLVTDGIATAGETEPSALLASAAALRAAGVRRVDVLASSGSRDDKLLGELVMGRAERGGVVYGASLPASTVARRLALAARAGVKLEVPGATWIFPAELPPMQAGDQALVFAELPERAPLAIRIGEERRAVRTSDAPGPLLHRAAVRAKIEELERRRDRLPETDDTRNALRDEIVQLSTKNRVLSELTGFLVLESERDYQRFGIDRTAPDLLVFGKTGLELAPRGALDPKAAGGGHSGAVDGDADRDGIPDALDKCPAEPETFNGFEDDDGCPDHGRVIVESCEIRVLLQIHFKDGSAQIETDSVPILTETAKVLEANPFITLLEIAGHTDNFGAAEANLALSLARANAIKDWLVAHGVQARRLQAKGYGASRPVDSNATEDGRARNRRIEFRILESDGKSIVTGKFARPGGPTYTGELERVMSLLKGEPKDPDAALATARAWRAKAPGDLLATIGLGESYEALGRADMAARAYGSIEDLAPSQAEMRRLAADRLDRLARGFAPLALDARAKARAARPDQPASHRALAWALARAGRWSDAFDAMEAGARRTYPTGQYAGLVDVLRGELGVLGVALVRARPDLRAATVARLAALGAKLETAPSLRFALSWEEDTMDVDLHVRDARTTSAAYAALPAVADVTTGFGPEVVVIDGAARAYPYKIEAQLETLGSAGYAMGKLEIVEHDGNGRLAFAERPFVIMSLGGVADLGTVTGALAP